MHCAYFMCVPTFSYWWKKQTSKLFASVKYFICIYIYTHTPYIYIYIYMPVFVVIVVFLSVCHNFDCWGCLLHSLFISFTISKATFTHSFSYTTVIHSGSAWEQWIVLDKSDQSANHLLPAEKSNTQYVVMETRHTHAVVMKTNNTFTI